MKIHIEPKLFEFDDTENIVDVFVRKDFDCPYPFHKEDWYHQGFHLKNFITYLNDFFARAGLPYKVTSYDADPLSEEEIDHLNECHELYKNNPIPDDE